LDFEAKEEKETAIASGISGRSIIFSKERYKANLYNTSPASSTSARFEVSSISLFTFLFEKIQSRGVSITREETHHSICCQATGKEMKRRRIVMSM